MKFSQIQKMYCYLLLALSAVCLSSFSFSAQATMDLLVVYHCQSWDGCATATVVKSSEK
ncbi:hypothetical protein ACKAAV_002545 [Proteus mirabilis]|nr:hypothetical protein [Proteus mirabilis]MTT05884.1 hypothetical protein [Proteus mirabilis]HEK2944631.1 hypothetical protein [Proteus mirabilis]